MVVVTPVLKFGPWEPKTVYGLVKTSFANPDYLSQQCATPIQVSSWNLEYTQALVGDACMEIDHAAQGYHNYQQYMGRWASLTNSGNGTKVQTDRPQGFGLFLENTTVTGSWIHIINTTAVSEHYNRIINNVTLAMPHTGVFQAARDPLSDIMQPEVSQISNSSRNLHFGMLTW
jgi:hypothetical protein